MSNKEARAEAEVEEGVFFVVTVVVGLSKGEGVLSMLLIGVAVPVVVGVGREEGGLLLLWLMVVKALELLAVKPLPGVVVVVIVEVDRTEEEEEGGKVGEEDVVAVVEGGG